MFGILPAFAVGLVFIIVALVIVAVRFFLAARTGNVVASPVVIHPGAAVQLIRGALTGNRDMVIAAARESFDLHLADGSIEQKLLVRGFAEVQKQLNDPNGKAPLIKAVAHFSGLTEQQVFDIFKAELLPNAAPQPTTPPVVASPAPAAAAAVLSGLTAVAARLLPLALFLSLATQAWARSPLPSPQRWDAPEQKIVLDSPTFYRPISIAERDSVLLPNSQYQDVRPIGSIRYSGNAEYCQVRYDGELRPNRCQCHCQQQYQQPQRGACPLPDRGPTIYVHYFATEWCDECELANEKTDTLEQAGWKVLRSDADSESGQLYAKHYRIKQVPTWFVTVDGVEKLRTSNHRVLYDYLNRLAHAVKHGYQLGQASAAQTQVAYWHGGFVRRWIFRPFRGLFGRRC